MKTFYILGENSFLAKNFYLHLRQSDNKYKIILTDHQNIKILKQATSTDTIVNFCGINRAENYDSYHQANYLFLKKIIATLNTDSLPHLIHISSLMVCGFAGKSLKELGNYQQWFITSKLNGEKYLQEQYPSNQLSIIRPSNIYGYNCLPYYNNLLTTLVYEKIKQCQKINTININCYRNWLSVESFTRALSTIINNHKTGIINIKSSKSYNLGNLLDIVYPNGIPKHLILNEAQPEVPQFSMNEKEDTISIIECLEEKVLTLETHMQHYLDLKAKVQVRNLPLLSQSRGEMIEISSLESKRLYKITLTPGAVRGNHYHHMQIEEFYTNHGTVLFLLALNDYPLIVYMIKSVKNDLIRVEPNIIHTLVNDYVDNNPEIIIQSTQEYIPGIAPDTHYVNIV